MIYTIESREYGTIVIDREQATIYFEMSNHKYIFDISGEFYDEYGILWGVRFLSEKLIIEKVTWQEIGRTKL